MTHVSAVPGLVLVHVSGNGRHRSDENGRRRHGHQRKQRRGMASAHHASDPCRLDLTRRLAHISNALHKKRCRNADYDPAGDDMGLQPTARK